MWAPQGTFPLNLRNCPKSKYGDKVPLFAHRPRSLSNEGWMPVPADLVMRCEEALSWRRTGILRDGGALRQLANRIRNQFGGALLEDEAITHAEEKTEREAMQLVVALSTRKGSAGDGAATGTKGVPDNG